MDGVDIALIVFLILGWGLFFCLCCAVSIIVACFAVMICVTIRRKKTFQELNA